MQRALATGLIIIGVLVTAVGCNQLWSPSPGQAPPAVGRGLPIQQPTVPSAPHLELGSKLSPLFLSILTPNPASTDDSAMLISATDREPAAGGDDVIPDTRPDQQQFSRVPTPAPGHNGTTASMPAETPVSVSAPAPLGGPPTLILEAANSTVSVGQDVELRLSLSRAPTGLSGFILELQISDPSVAEILSGTIPNFGLATVSALPADSAKIQAVDLSQLVNPTSSEVLLCTFMLKGIVPGTTEVRVLVSRVDDDNGQPLNPIAHPIRLTVQ